MDTRLNDLVKLNNTAVAQMPHAETMSLILWLPPSVTQSNHHSLIHLQISPTENSKYF